MNTLCFKLIISDYIKLDWWVFILRKNISYIYLHPLFHININIIDVEINIHILNIKVKKKGQKKKKSLKVLLPFFQFGITWLVLFFIMSLWGEIFLCVAWNGSCNTFSSLRHFVAKILASTTKSLTSKQEQKILYYTILPRKIEDVKLYKVVSF